MKTLEYRTGHTAVELAKRWGLSEQRIREYTAEASRRVRADVTDPDRVRETVSAALETILKDGLKSKDRRHVVSAAKVWSQITGAHAAIKVQVREEPVERLPDDKLESLVKEAVDALDPKKKGST